MKRMERIREQKGEAMTPEKGETVATLLLWFMKVLICIALRLRIIGKHELHHL